MHSHPCVQQRCGLCFSSANPSSRGRASISRGVACDDAYVAPANACQSTQRLRPQTVCVSPGRRQTREDHQCCQTGIVLLDTHFKQQCQPCLVQNCTGVVRKKLFYCTKMYFACCKTVFPFIFIGPLLFLTQGKTINSTVLHQI